MKTILYIEDDAVSRTLVRRVLEPCGYKIIEASNARDGLKMATAYKPDLILMDINMPGMNGYELTTKMKDTFALSSIPIVALTSLASEGEREMAIMAGCDGFIAKPIDVDRFPDIIAEYLSGKRDEVDPDKKSHHLKEYSRRLVARLEDKINELSKAEKEWEDTFNAISDMVSIHNSEHVITKANLSLYKRLKLPADKIIGEKCYKIFHNRTEPCEDCPCNKTMKTFKPETSEMQNPYLGGVFLINTYPIFDEKGKFISVVYVAIDITERKQMEEQVLQMEKLSEIGKLVSSVAHELNNPLTGIIGYAEHLLDIGVPPEAEKGLKIILKESERSTKIIRSLLDFSRKHKPEREEVNVNSLIESILTLKGYQMKSDSINIVKEFKEPAPLAKGDFHQLQQVVLNIINNAHYAMHQHHKKGVLTIRTSEDDLSVLFSFENDGPVIKKEDMKKIFEPFFTTKEAGKGTGLGLSICKKIITEHGGTIEAESEVGKGSRFTVKLPKP
ncbi:MAG: response regulator [Nitrospinae bacterium]|nr:response regulator [Nitrospinota bacterium]